MSLGNVIECMKSIMFGLINVLNRTGPYALVVAVNSEKMLFSRLSFKYFRIKILLHSITGSLLQLLAIPFLPLCDDGSLELNE